MAYGQSPFGYSPYPFGNYNAPIRPDTQMGQMYSQPQNVPPAAPVGQTQGISPMSRPVTSKEEAMGIAADFSGAPMIFPDMAHNVVFVKRWDFQSGSAVFTEYIPKDSVPETPAVTYATEDTFNDFAAKMTERLDEIESDIDRLKRKGAKKNDPDE